MRRTIALGFVLALRTASGASADKLKKVTVTNQPAVQQVTGSVEVSNQPAVQQVSGEVAVTNHPSES